MKIIRNEKDYEAALEQMDILFDAEPGTDEFDEMEVLALLIENYEEEHFAMDLPDPIEAIKFRMDQEGLKQKDLIPLIGSRSKVSEVLSGKTGLSLKMIRNIHRQLGISAEVLLRESGASLSDATQDLEFEKFPAKEMLEAGAFQFLKMNDPLKDVGQTIRGLLADIGSMFNMPAIQYRKSGTSRLNEKRNPYALLGWSFHAMSLASREVVPEKFDADLIDKTFLKGLTALSVLDKGPLRAKEFLAKYGIVLLYLPQYRKTYLDGAAFLRTDGTPVIVITGRYDRLDNFWFVLLHELGHVVKHLDQETCPSLADDMSLRGLSAEDSIEKEADAFAEEALIPADIHFDPSDHLSTADVKAFARRHELHPAILAGRIQYTRKDYKVFRNLLGNGEVWKCFDK
ncbi:MAG: ImmA/IrrE family metallo-endopeptidase [Spirochaetaceae bacterium]|nr:ImmA/IrrE family metallo-endopeptidase [Spirochaetaceae bacterium]MDT8297394.1 ImmA/IrrE family metallo-endopeptidase [Spirochaetaceae bacterium]